MDKDDVANIYKWMLAIRRKKKLGSFIDVDGPRECHTEWSKSERDKRTLCINADKWTLENRTDDILCKIEIEA